MKRFVFTQTQGTTFFISARGSWHENIFLYIFLLCSYLWCFQHCHSVTAVLKFVWVYMCNITLEFWISESKICNKWCSFLTKEQHAMTCNGSGFLLFHLIILSLSFWFFQSLNRSSCCHPDLSSEQLMEVDILSNSIFCSCVGAFTALLVVSCALSLWCFLRGYPGEEVPVREKEKEIYPIIWPNN